MRDKIALILLLSMCMVSCGGQSGPPSTSQTSVALPQIRDRIEFIEEYVTFRRSYSQLEYDIVYHNNSGGMVPGPSEWDIKIRAIVPTEQITDWIPTDVLSSDEQSPQWLRQIPGTIPVDGVTEWYREGRIEVGVDRTKSIVAYRNLAY